jgi:hypothetical protein
MVGFERHVGAAADAKELEYISALHQTDPEGVRTDGSIQGETVRYVKSLIAENRSGF